MSSLVLNVRTVGRLVLVAALTCASTALLPVAPSHPSQLKYQPFGAIGVVETADAVTGQFTLKPDQVSEEVQAAQSDDGTLSISTHPDTRYYKQDAATGEYLPAKFQDVIVPNTQIQVAGRYSKTGDLYRLIANYTWSPPPATIVPAAVNPKPSKLGDYTFRQAFSATGSVSQTGVPLSGSYLWSSAWGFVINVADGSTGEDARLAQVATAHRDQLPITVTAATKFYDDAGRASTREAVVKLGAPLFVGGRYAWTGLDWTLLASYVFPPPTTQPAGRFAFDASAARTSDGSPQATGGFNGVAYDGQISSGDGQLNPGTIRLVDIVWELNSQTARWDFTGTWRATHAGDGAGVGGPITGSWNPMNGAMSGDVVIDPAEATSYYTDVSGGGTFTGVGVADPDADKPPVLSWFAAFTLQTSRS
jgi:hypothetical protein